MAIAAVVADTEEADSVVRFVVTIIMRQLTAIKYLTRPIPMIQLVPTHNALARGP